MQPRGLSIFFPAYNDGGTIASMVISALRTAREITDDYEVIVVNDGSSDYTPEILDELERTFPAVRVIHHQKNRGYGGALRSGFAAATKEFVFYTDGDAQYDVRELTLLWDAMEDGVDLINGYKIQRHDPENRIIVGMIYQHVIKFFFRLRLRDVDCDFRLLRRSVFQKVHLQSNSGIICVELMRKVQAAGFRLKEVPVHHYHRSYGKSQFFNFPRVTRTLAQLAGLWWELMAPRVFPRFALHHAEALREALRRK